MLEKGPLNRLFPLANYINCDPLCDHPKSKAQTTKASDPLRKVELFFGEKEKEKNIRT